jgi:hypothetical protein
VLRSKTALPQRRGNADQASYCPADVQFGLFEVAISGMVGEYVLQDLLPGLGSEEAYRDRAEFKLAAAAAFRDYWRPA